MGALLALPAMWMDHTPTEIARSLVGVLAGILELRSAYARLEGTAVTEPITAWWPGTDAPPRELLEIRASDLESPGLTAFSLNDPHGRVRVAVVPVSLPWESAHVLVAAEREDFPTDLETHLLRIAVGQAVIAFHTARALADERQARRSAEMAMHRTEELVRTLTREIEPALSTVARQLRRAINTRISDEGPRARTPDTTEESHSGHDASSPLPSGPRLSRRETEVLGLLAQGLSNREIAGVLWLSDRTVERHVTSLYRKIGVARRSEATAFALGHPNL